MSNTVLLADPYYPAAHEVFRRATNQTAVMLDELSHHVPAGNPLHILSVGSGTGLFEIPMLERLVGHGRKVARFVGVEPSPAASSELARRMRRDGPGGFDFEVVTAPFESYESLDRFDLVLFNHVFEYLTGDPLVWINKSIRALTHQGVVLIFSPQRDAINEIYAEVFADATGRAPLFADDIENALQRGDVNHKVASISAECDVSLLERPDDDVDKLKLLSFLTQADCRKVSEATVQHWVDHYLAMRPPGSSAIPHPVTLFVL